MNDRMAYALHALLNDHYDMGRILRFRQMRRGTQADCYELLTAEHNEFTLFLFPPEFSRQSLADAAPIMEQLASAGFPVSRPVASRQRSSSGAPLFAIEGPQGSHFFVTTIAPGQMAAAADWSNHDLSNLGLRLGWMHRAMRDALAADSQPAAGVPRPDRAKVQAPAMRLVAALESGTSRGQQVRQMLPAAALDRLLAELEKLEKVFAAGAGYVHGGISPESVLLDHDRHIAAIVDWGVFSTGIPAQDVIDAFMSWCVHKDGEVRADAAQALLQAYLSLEKFRGDQWYSAVISWCAARLGAAVLGRKHLPRGFAGILENPHSLSATLTICQSKL